MTKLLIPYDREHLAVDLDERRIAAILAPAAPRDAGQSATLVAAALRAPLSSPTLAELARGKRRITVVTSDHTRPLPSRETLPSILAEIRRGNPDAEITILIGTGTHRPSSVEEMTAKYGLGVVGRERLVNHRGDDPGQLTSLGTLPSGVTLELNRLAVEADLLVAEGFIEPHFFAGFSGGPKSILPGIAGHRTIRANHSGPNIGHPGARTGILAGNPIHEEMRAAADMTRLAFVLNVVLGKEGRIVAAFAGDWRAAHAAGMAFAAAHCRVSAVPAAITITSNGGYPLDQNLYQAVKGMTAAEATTLPGGRIIMVAGCVDGLGGTGFADLLAGMSSPAAFCVEAEKVPPGETPPDLWQAQILARVLRDHRVTLVTVNIPPSCKLPPGLTICPSLERALAEALDEAGPDAKVTVIPDGVAVIVDAAV